MMLFSVIFCAQTAIACLSKYHSPEHDEILYRAIPREARRAYLEADYQERRHIRNEHTTKKSLVKFQEQMESANTGISECFGSGKAVDGGLYITQADTFEAKKRMVTYWLAMHYCGYYDPILQYLRVCSAKGSQPAGVKRSIIVINQLVLFFNAKLYKTSEATLPAFLADVKTYATLLSYVQDEQLQFETENPDAVAHWHESGEILISKLCAKMINKLLQFVMIFDPERKIFDSLRADINDSTLRFECMFLELCNAPFTAESVQFTFRSIKTRIKHWARENEQIKADFLKLLETIKTKMDAQFEDQSPEDLNDQSNFSTDEAKVPAIVDDEQVENKEPTAENSSTAENKMTHAEILETRKKNKESRTESQHLKQKLKHEAHLEKIEHVSESDDSDIQFYYNAKNPSANAVFNKNQDAQVSKMAFAKADRFQHSIYPDITASGETINFLCSLLVSGTPTYEGFLAAHKDLGGVFVEKKNGNKLFFFDEPISYHKTLHSPHLSSRFDHVLYRRFYRNCALHPYFFKLLD